MNGAMRAVMAIAGPWAAAALVACSTLVSPQPTATPAQVSFPTQTIPLPTAAVATPTFTVVPTPTTTPHKLTSTPLPLTVPSPTPRAKQFDDLDSRALLSALFPDLQFTPADDAFRVNGDPDWTMWINSRAEGQFTQQDIPELAAIVANDAPHLSSEQASRYAPWGSFLAIFQKRGSVLEVTQRAYLFPLSISPEAFEVTIDRVTDFDHDGQNELLVVTTTMSQGVATSAGFLYLWNDQAFVPVWSQPLAEDNTSALNQSEYYSTESELRIEDIDGNGMDEIVVDGTRITYARDTQGLADTDHELSRTLDRRVFRWGGALFVLDPGRTTPAPPRVTRTP